MSIAGDDLGRALLDATPFPKDGNGSAVELVRSFTESAFPDGAEGCCIATVRGERGLLLAKPNDATRRLYFARYVGGEDHPAVELETLDSLRGGDLKQIYTRTGRQGSIRTVYEHRSGATIAPDPKVEVEHYDRIIEILSEWSAPSGSGHAEPT